MKPGKPLTFATLERPVKEGDPSSPSSPRRMLVFGLPGNPVSCVVCFNLFVLPALRRIAGWTHPEHRK